MSKVGVGHSTKRSSVDAAGEAVRAALASLDGKRPNALLVFANPGYNVATLLDTIRAQAGAEAVLVGCSSEGIMFRGGCNELVCAVNVMAIASDTIEFHGFNVPGFSKNPQACGAEIGRRISELGHERARAALVFPDGVTGNTTAMLRGLDAALAFPIPITGGAAGDLLKADARKFVTQQFLNGEVTTDSVSVLVLGGAVAMDVTVSHGSTPLGLPRTVTSGEGGWVHEIDGRPAWAVMKEYLNGDPTNLVSADIVHLCVGEPFDSELRNAAAHGFGLEFLIRTPLAQSADGKSLFFPGGLQLGNKLQFLRRDPTLVGASAKQSAVTLAERRNGRSPLAVLQFDCSGRARALFGERTADTVVRPLQAVFGDTPWTGFFTFGEIAQIGGKSCYHNFTVALCALYDT